MFLFHDVFVVCLPILFGGWDENRLHRTDVNMWPISGVLYDNTCRRLKTSSKGQQMQLVCYPVMKSADVKQTKITVSVEEKFSRTVLHQVLSLDTDTSSFACEWARYDGELSNGLPCFTLFLPTITGADAFKF